MVQIAELETVPETMRRRSIILSIRAPGPSRWSARLAGSDVRSGGGEADPHRVVLRNGRPHADSFALERDGFRFVHHDTKVRDFYDEDEIRRVYYPEMEALVKARAAPSASSSSITPCVRRTRICANREDPRGRAPRAQRLYRIVAPKRVRDLLPDEADGLLARRFAIVQVWRPIRHPVECWPLAIADAQSLSPDDMVVTEQRYEDRIGQTSAITYNPAHRWYWFPHMRPDEALVFKEYQFNEGRPRPVHRAHRLRRPGHPPPRPARESIEIRTLAFF